MVHLEDEPKNFPVLCQLVKERSLLEVRLHFLETVPQKHTLAPSWLSIQI